MEHVQDMSAKDEISEQYLRRAGGLLLSIARKATGSGLETASRRKLRGTRAALLLDLADRGSATIRELASRNNVRSSVARFFINGLERKNLVARTAKAGPGGSAQISLTQEGMKVAGELRREYIMGLETALRGTSQKERETFLTLMILIDESLVE